MKRLNVVEINELLDITKIEIRLFKSFFKYTVRA